MPVLNQFTPDVNTKMKDAGLIAADARWQVSAANQYLDLGGAAEVGRIDANLHIEVTAIEIASNDELYKLHFQLSTSATFASVIVSPLIVELGALEVLTGLQDTDSATGHYVFPVSNDFGGTLYRYCSGYTDVAGAIATGINFDAWLDFGH
ncbi:MAG: hypothetical protein O7A04_12330 [Acidobacteria bacterium]|nr:hypothetical protein [Acidobacteriota bacterium]